MRICKKYQIDPESAILGNNERKNESTEKDADLSSWNGLFRFPQNAKYRVYTRYHAEATEADEEKKYKEMTPVTPPNPTAPVDEHFDQNGEYSSWVVLAECGIVWDATLNQTNIGQNNNKFYKLQILTNSDQSQFCAFFRWARVGYKGQMRRDFGNKQENIE